jgi:pre-mRNA-processing factor 19
MSALVCSLSGNPIIEGVVSVKTGHLYEKSTILKHLKAFGKCPHTDQLISNTDLVDIQNLNNSFFTQGKSIS